MLKWFPLLIISVIFYNLLVYSGELFGATSGAAAFLASPLLTLGMFSGVDWTFRIEDFVILMTMVFLFVEVIKATGTSSVEVINHGLSALVFIVALIEFIVLPEFATSAFFFVMLAALFDVIAGFTISIVAAKRDLAVVSEDR